MSDSSTPRRVSRRPGQKNTSTVRQELRLTPDEKEQWQELAETRVMSVSDLIRQLMAREYDLQFPGRRRASKRPRRG